jgi:hypothetical protein
MAHSIAHRPQLRRGHEMREREIDIAERHVAADQMYQHSRYGGMHLGSSFFGWIVATGFAVLLTALLAATGSAVALTQLDTINIQNTLSGEVSVEGIKTVGIVSGAFLLAVLAIAYYAGGYVAGRMARFDGARQGIGVWLVGIIVTVILAGLASIIGSEFNILQGLNLPYIPTGDDSFTRGGLATALIAVIVTLIAATSGGKVGERYHRKVDRASIDHVTH